MSGNLINQPSKMPTRKLGAVIIATFFVYGGVAVIEAIIPDLAGNLPAQRWVEALIPILAGYFVRERAVEPPAGQTL